MKNKIEDKKEIFKKKVSNNLKAKVLQKIKTNSVRKREMH